MFNHRAATVCLNASQTEDKFHLLLLIQHQFVAHSTATDGVSLGYSGLEGIFILGQKWSVSDMACKKSVVFYGIVIFFAT